MKNQKENKKMTIDGLAVLMKQGFGRIDKKLETNQESMATMVKNAFQGNQEYMDKRFDVIDEKFNAVDGKFEEVSYKLDKIDKKLDSQEKTIFNHDNRIDKLEVDAKKVKKVLAI